MIKRIVLAGIAALPLALQAQVEFSVVGKVNGVSDQAKAYLHYLADGQYTLDSVNTTGGEFKFHGIADEPSQATVLLMHQGEDIRQATAPDLIEIYIEQGAIAISSADSLSNASVKGGELNKNYTEYKGLSAPVYAKMIGLNQRYFAASEEQQQNPEFIGGLQAEFAVIREEQKKVDFDYIKNNTGSLISLDVLASHINEESIIEVIEPAFNSLNTQLKNSSKGKQIAEHIQSQKVTDVGAIAPDFTLPDTAGTDFTLSSLRGKYVLIDFWASWCGPCRRENPNIVAAYDAFKDKDFIILGVSLDRPGQKEAWLKAIEDDQLQNWPQVSDLKGWESDVATLYGVRSIPQSFLLDPQGKIIAKNLRGDELHSVLAEILN